MDEASNILKTTKDHFLTSIRVFGIFLKISGINLDKKSASNWNFWMMKTCGIFWILASIQNYIYLVILRSAFGTMFHLLIANKNSTGHQLMSDLIFVLRQLGLPLFRLTTHIMLFINIGSTMKSFWTALKPINRLLNRQELTGIRKRSIFAFIWIMIVV